MSEKHRYSIDAFLMPGKRLNEAGEKWFKK